MWPHPFQHVPMTQAAYQLGDVVYLPHYTRPDLFVQPGYPRHYPETLTHADLRDAGAKKILLPLWPRFYSKVLVDVSVEDLDRAPAVEQPETERRLVDIVENFAARAIAPPRDFSNVRESLRPSDLTIEEREILSRRSVDDVV